MNINELRDRGLRMGLTTTQARWVFERMDALEAENAQLRAPQQLVVTKRYSPVWKALEQHEIPPFMDIPGIERGMVLKRAWATADGEIVVIQLEDDDHGRD